jgi:hypothetical protein
MQLVPVPILKMAPILLPRSLRVAVSNSLQYVFKMHLITHETVAPNHAISS